MTAKWRGLQFLPFNKYENHQIKEGETGGTCRKHGTDEKCIELWLENTKGRNHSEDLDVDGRIISEWILGEIG